VVAEATVGVVSLIAWATDSEVRSTAATTSVVVCNVCCVTTKALPVVSSVSSNTMLPAVNAFVTARAPARPTPPPRTPAAD
jgi:hypothetical protein